MQIWSAEKLFRKCSASWLAYQYLQVRVHEPWLPDSARQQVRGIIKRISAVAAESRIRLCVSEVVIVQAVLVNF
jgi:hypothetical protein